MYLKERVTIKLYSYSDCMGKINMFQFKNQYISFNQVVLGRLTREGLGGRRWCVP